MGEYEDRYPESYGNSEGAEAADVPVPVNTQVSPRPTRHVERVQRPLVERAPQEICDDVFAQLNASPSIDASGISISVDGSEVTLEGTINSLIAVSMARALASNVPGVSRVQVQLRVRPSPYHYTGPDNA